MTSYSLSEVCQVWQRQPYRGTVLIQNTLENISHYLIIRDRELALITDALPENSAIIAHMIEFMGEQYRPRLEQFSQHSPSQFLEQAITDNIFTPKEFNNSLTRYLLDRMYGFLSQSFTVQLKPEIGLDINFGVSIEYLLNRLTEKQMAWQQYIASRFANQFKEQSPETKTAPRNLTVADLVCFPLSQAQSNDRVYLHRLDCEKHNARLLGMGFAPGVAMEVVHTLPQGGVMVGLKEQRLGLGAEMAAGMIVIRAPDWEQVKSLRGAPEIKLAAVPIGTRLRVVGYEPTAREYKRKLLAMGLTPGVDILVKCHGPLQIEVRGFALSLQPDEAEALRVTLL